MPTNQQIIEKAAMMLSDLSTGGKMNDTQFNTFYRKVIDSPTILRDCRTVVMPIDSMKIEKIGFGTRILRPGVEGVALLDNQLSKPTTSTITLNAKEVIAEVNITYDTLENNIEGDRLYDTIMNMIAERVSLDLEELILNGDTSLSATDPYLAILNGLRKKATSHVVDYANADLTKTLFKKLYNAVPTKYIRNPGDWRFYVSYSNELEWKDTIANRQTALGDQGVTSANVPTAYGVPVRGIAMLQPYTSNSVDVNDGFFTHPKNILTGISRNIRVEVDKDIRARKFIIVVTAKIDTQFEEEDAVAKAIKIKNTISG
jgi:hypothetical protein